LAKRLLKLKWDRALNEVRPLLEPNAPPELLTRENVMRVLEATMPEEQPSPGQGPKEADP
jgi:hypothetical protein